MANKDFLNKIKNERYESVTIDDITFKLKKLDEIAIQNLHAKASRQGETGNQFEVEMVISSIVSFKGLKGKHLVEDITQYTEAELVAEIEYESAQEMRDIVSIYLGQNQTVLVQLYEKVANDLMKVLDLRNKQKKTSTTELNT